jgi:hypothetical protein
MLIDYSQRLLFCRSHYERLCLAALFHRQTLALMYIRLGLIFDGQLLSPTTTSLKCGGICLHMNPIESTPEQPFVRRLVPGSRFI